jgi:hypothetical protein
LEIPDTDGMGTQDRMKEDLRKGIWFTPLMGFGVKRRIFLRSLIRMNGIWIGFSAPLYY